MEGEGAPPRASDPELALREAIGERNRLWEELQRRRSAEEEAAYWRARAEDIEASRWWRLGRPLRLARRFAADPATALSDASAHIRRRRSR